MLLAVAVVLALLAPLQQRAMAKGVFFDPDSPAGKEYALPLDQARDEAAGVGKSDGPAGEKAPLFGEGVSRGGSGSGPGSGGASAGGGSGADRTGATAGNGAGGQGQQLQLSAVAISSANGSSYALSSAILWIAVIVALGAIVGLVLRAMQRPRPS